MPTLVPVSFDNPTVAAAAFIKTHGCGDNTKKVTAQTSTPPDYVYNSLLISGQNIGLLTKLKSVYSSEEALLLISKHDDKIEEVANTFSIPSDMIRSVLYREISCMGIEDLMADQAVKNYHEKRIFSIKLKQCSTGIGQIYPTTALAAEKAVLHVDSELGIWDMWQELQDDDTNIYYVGMVLRMEADGLGYENFDADEYEKIQRIFSYYNGDQSYGKQVIDNYKEFQREAN